ncbi:MAG: DUF2092 domain-containing protein [Steroidobacteraceae bacterium]
MKTQHWRRHAITVAMAATSICFSGASLSQDTTAPNESQQLATEMLSGMTNYLAGLPGFQVQLVASYDTVQESGQKIEFNEIRAITVSRPNLLRVEQQFSDGAQDLLVFDGQQINVYDSQLGVYAQAPQPGSVDDAVVYFVRDLGMRLPLAAMLSTRLPEELSKRMKSVDYVEYTTILGTGAHHIAARGATVDMQVWIADGDRPLPLRIVLTYKTDPGQPQFRAQFLAWDEKSRAPADFFKFSPPAGAQKIIFAVQGPAAAPEAAPTGSLP